MTLKETEKLQSVLLLVYSQIAGFQKDYLSIKTDLGRFVTDKIKLEEIRQNIVEIISYIQAIRLKKRINKEAE